MSEPRAPRRTSLIVYVVALAVAIAAHLLVGSLFGTPQGRRLDPNSWGLQTVGLAYSLAILWRGSQQGRRTLMVLGVLMACLIVVWIAETG